ncbi:MAG: hypothetical protein JWQ94_3732 [Tardiphaga sp.]|nr:hypothetical protein [Tardiphaga sp.]
MMNRRSILTGVASIICAPAIVKASGLMKVTGDTYRFWQHSLPLLPDINQPAIGDWLGPNGHVYIGTWTLFGKDRNIYSDEVVGFTKAEFVPPTH